MRYLILFFFCLSTAFAQNKEQPLYNTIEIAVSPLIKGNLNTPVKPKKNTDLVILIAGSGPTDRDGNQAGMQNNSLKYLAELLAENGIASFSYDKRIFVLAQTGVINEKELSFEDFIADAKNAISYFRAKKKYRHIIIAGHSEGSLIGMVAAKGNADGYVSLAGPGRSIDLVIEDQLAGQPAELREEAHKYLLLLKSGQTFELKNPMLGSIFRESIQPYMISWIKFDPAAEIKQLKIPVLLINGTKDLQVKPTEAALLKKAYPDAKLVIIENMNHVFKDIAGDEKENSDSYSNPLLPINKQLTSEIVRFVKSI